jgi:hypothetical protein
VATAPIRAIARREWTARFIGFLRYLATAAVGVQRQS